MGSSNITVAPQHNGMPVRAILSELMKAAETSEGLAEELILAIWWTPTTMLQKVGSKINANEATGAENQPSQEVYPCLHWNAYGSIPELNISWLKKATWECHSKEPRRQSQDDKWNPPLASRNAKRCGWWAGNPKQTIEEWPVTDWSMDRGPRPHLYLHCLEHINSKKI